MSFTAHLCLELLLHLFLPVPDFEVVAGLVNEEVKEVFPDVFLVEMAGNMLNKRICYL